MYEQIARNKRRSAACVLLFFLIWLGAGAVAGLVAAQFAQPGTPSPRTADILTGTAVAAVLALAGIAYSLSSGARLVLAVSGAHPAGPDQHPQLHHIIEALAIGDGIPKPAVYVIDDPSPNAFATGTRHWPGLTGICAETRQARTESPSSLSGRPVPPVAPGAATG